MLVATLITYCFYFEFGKQFIKSFDNNSYQYFYGCDVTNVINFVTIIVSYQQQHTKATNTEQLISSI